MLAIRLHKKKRPKLNKYTFLIPIMSWETGRVQVLNWVNVLNKAIKLPNNAIRYITLVKIPDDHPVELLEDFSCKWGCKIKDLDFKPLKEHPEKVKQRIMKWDNRECVVTEDSEILFDESGPNCVTPELILGEALPKSCIKWTKDIKLLYKGSTKVRSKS